MKPIGIKFGDPAHPYRPTDTNLKRAARKGKNASPWSRSPMITTERARRIFALPTSEKIKQ